MLLLSVIEKTLNLPMTNMSKK